MSISSQNWGETGIVTDRLSRDRAAALNNDKVCYPDKSPEMLFFGHFDFYMWVYTVKTDVEEVQNSRKLLKMSEIYILFFLVNFEPN